MTLQAIYGDWRLYNDLVVEALRTMSTEELLLRVPSGDPNLEHGLADLGDRRSYGRHPGLLAVHGHGCARCRDDAVR